MKNETLALIMIMALLTPFLMGAVYISPVASASPFPTLSVDDVENKLHAALGAKSGSIVCSKGTVTNVGTTSLEKLLTAIHLKEVGGTLGVSDGQAWLSPDGINWPWTATIKLSEYFDYQIEILIGPPGGYSLDVGASSTTYVKIKALRNIGEIAGEVIVFVDSDLDYHYDSGETIVSSNDYPVKLDLAIWHTVEVYPAKFYWSIQEGIDTATSGDTVYVYLGIYAELITIDKDNLTITSVNGANTTIIKQVDTNAITIKGNWNIFEGFTVKDETNHAHVHRLFIIHGDYNTIRGNILVGRKGISGAGDDYLISIRGDGVGDRIAKGNIIEYNEVYNASRNGINVGGTYKAEDTIVRGNKVEGCVAVGIAVDRAPNTLVESNSVSGCGVGLYVEGREADGRPVSGTTVTANIIQGNLVGLQFKGANSVTVTCNTIKENGVGVQIIAPAAGSYGTPTIKYNNIYNNTMYGAENKITEKVDARYNWWGDPTGPYHSTLNPGGLGDEVSDNVDFKPWLLTEKVPPLVHDVAILNVVPSDIRVTPGTTVHVDVTVKNEGNTYETFNVSLYYDSHLIGTQIITDMIPGSTEHLTFSWDTSGVPYGTYTLRAEATVVPGETDTADNVFVDGMVRIGPEALIKVEPPLYQSQLLNKTFQVNVTINNLWEGWRAVAAQFRLCYNETLLQVVNVEGGPFMKDPRWNLHGTFFIWFDQPNDPIYGSHVIVGILLLPDPDTGVWEAFPSGSGVLATITFRTIYQERGLEKPPLTCKLKLVDTMVIDDDLEEIPLILEHGLYEMYPTHIGDINYDGKVDMKDVAMVSKAFGSYPGYGPWNPICDVNGDGKVDLKDVAIVSKGFGWTKTYDP